MSLSAHFGVLRVKVPFSHNNPWVDKFPDQQFFSFLSFESDKICPHTNEISLASVKVTAANGLYILATTPTKIDMQTPVVTFYFLSKTLSPRPYS